MHSAYRDALYVFKWVAYLGCYFHILNIIYFLKIIYKLGNLPKTVQIDV